MKYKNIFINILKASKYLKKSFINYFLYQIFKFYFYLSNYLIIVFFYFLIFKYK